MTDDRFEHELRSFLLARAPRGATAALRGRVGSVTSEATIAPSRWRSMSLEVWRAVAGLAAAAAVAVLVFAVLSRTSDTTVRDPNTVGGPSNAPATSAAPFVAVPTGFFTPEALTAAEERLRRVFAETGIEATFIVTPATSLQELSTPEGWRDGLDRDNDPSRDVTAVAGVTPNDTIVCCITITGATIDQARENLYWQPIDQPSALDDELAAATPAERDEALRGFVRGIEDLATGITELGIEPHPSDVLLRLMPLILFGSVVALLVATFPRPRRSTVRSGGQGDPAAEAETAMPAVEAIALPWPASKRLVTADWTPLVVALAAFGAIAAMTLADALRAPDRTVAFDPTRETIGIAQGGSPIVPASLAAIALVALIAYALRGGWRRRLGIAAALVLIVGSAWIAIGMTRPAGRDLDIAWVASPNGLVESRQFDGIRELVTYDVSPGETFAMAGVVRNTGVLPLTILGLDGVRSTTGNPYVASIVGLGWIPQPTDDGRVVLLAAAAEAASAAWPVTLAPREELAVLVLARAGACAEPSGTGPVLPLFRFPVRYRALGIEQTTDVSLPADMFVAAKARCTVEIPGGTVTYGTEPGPSAP